MQTRIPVLFSLGLFFAYTSATFQNVTVDDAVLSGPVVPQYLPDRSAWNIGNNCSSCLVQPNPALAYNHTWHDLTFSPSNDVSPGVEFSFTGNGLYVFFIIANNITLATTTTNVTFVLDGVTVGNYTHNPLATTDYEYNVPVFSNGSLENGAHNMLIQPAFTDFNTLILFDYLIYTTVTTSSSSNLNIAAIVGGTVGGVAATLLIISLLLYYRRSKRHGSSECAVDEPFVLSSGDVSDSRSVPTSQPRTAFLPERLERSKTGTLTMRESRDFNSNGSPSHITSAAISPSSQETPSNSGDTSLLEQVRQLRHDVAQILHLHATSPRLDPLEAPPEYE